MRADRLVSILLLLQMNGRMTARELAERLEVSERTIHRDMESLGAAGVPVMAERGAGGGWMLMDGYRTNLTGLNDAEVQALFLGGPASVLADLKLDKASDAALIKLLASLPLSTRRDAEYARQRIHVDVSGWSRQEETVPCLHALQEAVWLNRRVRLGYRRGVGAAEGETVERTVDPLGLVAKGSVWYLVGSVEGEPRSYRVSRVASVELLDDSCARPEGFDLAAFWGRSNKEFKDKFPRFDAVFRARADVAPRLYFAGRFARVEGVGEPDAEGWVEVRMRFQFDWEACEFALSFGPAVELVEPEELRGRVVRLAESVVEFYKRRAQARGN
ncbi:MAG TPA: YafY family protein [Pyrinomonadaceae bacterium]